MTNLVRTISHILLSVYLCSITGCYTSDDDIIPELLKLGCHFKGNPVVSISSGLHKDDDLKYVGKLYHLKSLTMGFEITNMGLDKVQGLAQLEKLNISGCINISDAGINR